MTGTGGSSPRHAHVGIERVENLRMTAVKISPNRTGHDFILDVLDYRSAIPDFTISSSVLSVL